MATCNRNKTVDATPELPTVATAEHWELIARLLRHDPRFYDILTALRGPDSGPLETKTVFTARIRALIMPGVFKQLGATERSSCRISHLNTSGADLLADLWTQRCNIPLHWVHHTNNALQALQDTGDFCQETKAELQWLRDLLGELTLYGRHTVWDTLLQQGEQYWK